jgi:methylthioribose-1-phosphate isomerase
MSIGAAFTTIRFIDNPPKLELLDQRVLPGKVCYVTCTSATDTADAIQTMVVRGAPAIGITAAYGFYLAVASAASSCFVDRAAFNKSVTEAYDILNASRPTAVNLKWALDRLRGVIAASSPDDSLPEICKAVLSGAHAIAHEDEAACRAMGQHGLELVPTERRDGTEGGVRILHHCNTGSLATSNYGTALGLIRAAHEADPRTFVYVDETRPRLQGARLTAFELVQEEIDHLLIVDSAAAVLMSMNKVDLVTVGSDRITADGHVANKIGTMSLAVNAKHFSVPFVVVAPISTVDLNAATGSNVEIENRADSEITHPCGLDHPAVAPAETKTFNPAFDITPPDLIAAIVTEFGVARPPYRTSLAALCALAGNKRR